jgi:hypothetical protein
MDAARVGLSLAERLAVTPARQMSLQARTSRSAATPCPSALTSRQLESQEVELTVTLDLEGDWVTGLHPIE